ncbi:hypothetical protein [Lysobacter gummosus]|uniref:hypothetical protein n=1 Tax=Lysobacter gummosus TaxID=262324 RepID=UPI00363879C7
MTAAPALPAASARPRAAMMPMVIDPMVVRIALLLAGRPGVVEGIRDWRDGSAQWTEVGVSGCACEPKARASANARAASPGQGR